MHFEKIFLIFLEIISINGFILEELTKTKINVEGAIERFLNGVGEYYEVSFIIDD